MPHATPRLLVTGSSGLIGSAVARYFHERGWGIHGIDNNQRAVFFGDEADTRWNQQQLSAQLARFTHHELDVRDRAGIAELIQTLKPRAIVHCAAQPSHDRAAEIPFDDFETNAVGTLNLLEAARHHCPEAPFVFLSTNKVYGDGPNRLPLVEQPTRWEFAQEADRRGIGEAFPIDHTKHSLFGVSKTAADLMVQEYGRYFGMPTCCLRCGCLTGPAHSGVELHGFLSYAIRCHLTGRPYTVFGYEGKQVRDNIHADDVAAFIAAFIEAPRCGEVYNLGGGRDNSISINELFARLRDMTGKSAHTSYRDTARSGDHICYYSDLRKSREHYPGWDIAVPLDALIGQIVEGWQRRLAEAGSRA